MKISTKGHYAVQALVDLAASQGGTPVALALIAERQNLSQPYLEQLFVKLRKAHLVRSVRGPGGGYLLARSPASVTIGEVFEAVDENLALTDCVDTDGHDSSSCGRGGDCRTQELWTRLCHHVNDLLYSITIADVVRGDFPIPAPAPSVRTTF